MIGAAAPSMASAQLLIAVRDEMRRSVGFENDQELRAQRELALNYCKGVMNDVPSLPNRSKAVSTDVADAIETVLPDLMEIFIGGDDVAALVPTKAEDVEAAKQETDYLNHVIFQDNPGFLNLYSGFKDALQLKTCIFKFWWHEDIDEEDEEFTGKSAVEVQLASQTPNCQILDFKQDAKPEGDLRFWQPSFSFTLRKTNDKSNAKYMSVAPDDFSVGIDTILIEDATYCCMRSRPRRQDLIADGFDADLVNKLPAYAEMDQQMQQARDTAGEHLNSQVGGDDGANTGLQQVEVRDHYLRLLDSDGLKCLYHVTTDAQAETLLDKEEVNRIPFAAGSPYLVAHRFHGESLADKLIEIQRLKTAFTRMVADSGYFALNQRFEVADSGANSYTISDLLRNEPAVPVRSKTGNAIRPINSGGLTFDAYAALEYFSTVGEQRTGIVRNAQGLNPDTLHDTAKGAMALLSAAQKRTRLIARILAEVVLKPLYLGIHATLRENASSERIVELSGKWVPVNPSKWAERTAMTIEVGLGASGKDAEIAAITSIAQDMQAIVEVQGGAQGPIVTLENVYKLAVDKAKKLGVKAPEEYYTDPNSPQGQAAQQAMANKPNPEMAKVQGEQALQQSKQQGEMQLGQMKVQAEKEIQANKSQFQAAADQHKQELEHAREVQKQQDAMQLELLKLQSAERIAIAVARIKSEGMIAAAEAKGNAAAAQAALDFEEQHETTTA